MIVKPDQLSQGNGIFLTNTLDDLQEDILESKMGDHSPLKQGSPTKKRGKDDANDTN